MERTWSPWLTAVMLWVSIAVFVISMRVNNCPDDQSYNNYGCVPAFLGPFSFQPLYQCPLIGPSGYGLYKMGAVYSYNVVHKHQGWSLLTYVVARWGSPPYSQYALLDYHRDSTRAAIWLWHYQILAPPLRAVKVGVVYFLSGVGENVVSCLFLLSSYISVGASGAVCGLAGAMLADLITNWPIYVYKAATVFTVVVTLAVNMGLGFLPSAVDNFSTLGGFFTGLLLDFVLLIRPRPAWSMRDRLPEEARFTITKFVVSLAMLFTGKNGNDHCGWCHYLSYCIPTSIWQCSS